MKPAWIFGTTAAAVAWLILRGAAPAAQPRVPVPLARADVRPVVDDYHGTKVVDPYRHLENLADGEVRSWHTSQNDYTRTVLASIPGRQLLLERMRALDRSAGAQVDGIVRLGERYFYRKLQGDDDAWKLYVRDGIGSPDRLLVDPERLGVSEANARKGHSAIAYFAPSHDGRFVAVGIVPGGSEPDTEIRVIDTASGQVLTDRILRAAGLRIHWLPDNRAFLYGRIHRAVPAYGTYLHVVGADAEKDQHVFLARTAPSDASAPQAFSEVITQAASDYVIGVTAAGVAANRAFYAARLADVTRPDAVWRRVADQADMVSAVTWRGDALYLITCKDAPRFKVVRVDLRKPDLSSARTVVAPSDAVVARMAAARDALYVLQRTRGASRLLRVPYDDGSAPTQVALPFDGTMTQLSSHAADSGVLFTLSSWTKMDATFAYDPTSARLSETRLLSTHPLQPSPALEALELEARSPDGTAIPLSIVRAVAKPTSDPAPAPTLLTVYGAYGAPHDALFVPPLLAWYERGGIWAICHVRGGGEYGHEWHLGGRGATKSNTWRDFMACADYLIDRHYTSPSRLAAEGASAGGIPVGRAITERPALFGAALINVGLSDMLRNETSRSGAANVPEFGTVRTPAGFAALSNMSAYAHVTDGSRYPAVLLTTGMNDARVAPWHAMKMAARLQAATASGKPILLRVDDAAGHLPDRREQLRLQLADEFSFLLWQFGDPTFQPRAIDGASTRK